MDLQNNVVSLRKAQGLNQEALAERLGVTRQTVSNWERGLADPLGENLVTSISFEEEHYNLILIEDGKVSVADADCPDQLCVRQRSISGNGESIICLPHRLVVQIESEEERKLDAIAY